MVSVRGVNRSACRCLKGVKAVQSKIICFIANNATVANHTNPVSPVYIASTSQTASSNQQAMTAQPKLHKALHAPPTNWKLTTCSHVFNVNLHEYQALVTQ